MPITLSSQPPLLWVFRDLVNSLNFHGVAPTLLVSLLSTPTPIPPPLCTDDAVASLPFFPSVPSILSLAPVLEGFTECSHDGLAPSVRQFFYASREYSVIVTHCALGGEYAETGLGTFWPTKISLEGWGAG